MKSEPNRMRHPAVMVGVGRHLNQLAGCVGTGTLPEMTQKWNISKVWYTDLNC